VPGARSSSKASPLLAPIKIQRKITLYFHNPRFSLIFTIINQNLNTMENVILIANCWEKVEIGYVSTHVKMDRNTNEVLSVTYHWHESFSTNNTKVFNSFESLHTFLNELIDLKK